MTGASPQPGSSATQRPLYFAGVVSEFPSLAERHDDGTVHDYRCSGECTTCWGADACGMVGMTCHPCAGECARKTGAVLPPVGKPA